MNAKAARRIGTWQRHIASNQAWLAAHPDAPDDLRARVIADNDKLRDQIAAVREAES